jgi:hypothetical protein
VSYSICSFFIGIGFCVGVRGCQASITINLPLYYAKIC